MRPLTSDIQLYTARMDRTPIVIFIGAELVGSGVYGNERNARSLYV